MDDRRRRFEAQIMPHLGAVTNLARWLARDRDLADDVVQDAMLRAYRAFDSIRGKDVKPWLLQIVRNCHRTLLSQAKLRNHVPLPDSESDADKAIAADEPGPETYAMRTSDNRKLEETIASLPQEFREVLILREMEDLSYREIADVAGVPIGTVMSRLARARALLRERWLNSDVLH